MKEIKKINKASLAKVAALMYACIGFVMSLIVAISVITNLLIEKDYQKSVILIILFNIIVGLLLGVLTGFLTGLVGWLIGYAMAAIYNLLARKSGGVKIELADGEEAGKGESPAVNNSENYDAINQRQ